MKTKNNIRETVDDQIKRIVIRCSAVIFGFALISLTVNAQDFWKQFSSVSMLGKIALLNVNQPSETEKTDAFFEIVNAEVSAKLNNSDEAFVCEPENDEEIQVKSWMTDESHFNTSVNFKEVETEGAMIVDEWMINKANFFNQLDAESVDFENPLEIESWMTIEECFNSVETMVSREPALEIENWILDNKNFSNNLVIEDTFENEPMQFETWMTNNHYWGF